MLCSWNNSESSALRGIQIRKVRKMLGALSFLYIPTLTEADEQLTMSMQLDKITSQGADIVCTQAGLGPIPFLIAGVHHNPENKRKLLRGHKPQKWQKNLDQNKGIFRVRSYQIPGWCMCGSILLLLNTCWRDPLPTWDPQWAAAPSLLSIASSHLCAAGLGSQLVLH